MDLLGSILKSMDKPPEIDDKRKEQMKSKLFDMKTAYESVVQLKSFFVVVVVVYRTKRTIGKAASL